MPRFRAATNRYPASDERIAQTACRNLRRIVHGEPLVKVRIAHRNFAPHFKLAAARLAIDLYTPWHTFFHRANAILDRETCERVELYARSLARFISGFNVDPQ